MVGGWKSFVWHKTADPPLTTIIECVSPPSQFKRKAIIVISSSPPLLISRPWWLLCNKNSHTFTFQPLVVLESSSMSILLTPSHPDDRSWSIWEGRWHNHWRGSDTTRLYQLSEAPNRSPHQWPESVRWEQVNCAILQVNLPPPPLQCWSHANVDLTPMWSHQCWSPDDYIILCFFWHSIGGVVFISQSFN